MAEKKVWREWQMTLNGIEFRRSKDGRLFFAYDSTKDENCYRIGSEEARRLFQKLSGDYKD